MYVTRLVVVVAQFRHRPRHQAELHVGRLLRRVPGLEWLDCREWVLMTLQGVFEGCTRESNRIKGIADCCCLGKDQPG
jgi:hypothetical protein